MSPERYQRITALVESALELPPARRDEFLTAACADDEELRRQSAELLAAREQSGDFLALPALNFLAEDVARDLESRELAGRRLGRYRVVRQIGKGGMGEVWLATDSQLGRDVALKLLAPESILEPSQTRRFQREAQAASALNHPNIVTIYEIGGDNGVSFIAQEYVLGETLRQRLAAGPVKLAAILDIGVQITAALAAAHDAGIVHRDIKPENVMLRPDGLVKVLDFGLARFVNTAPASRITAGLAATAPGLVVGTVNYMSPEQVRGIEVTAATDIFSLGVMLYEMIAGATPFAGPTAADVMAAVLQQEPKPLPRESTPHCAEIDRIVRRCLAKDPAARYSSAKDLRTDLMQLAAAIEADRRTARTARSLPVRWALLAIAGALVFLAFAMLMYRVPGSRQAWSPNAMHQSLLTVRSGLADAAISPDGKFVAYVLNESGGQSLWVRQVAAARDIRILDPEPGVHRGLTYSPDGNFLYYLRADDGGGENLYRVPVLGGYARQVLAAVNSPIAFAPNGNRFAFLRLDVARHAMNLMVAGADGVVERRIATRHRPSSYSPFGLAWSPDGRTIACLGNAGGADADSFNLLGIRVADGKESQITSQGWADAHSLIWLADGREILVAGKKRQEGVDQIWAASSTNGRIRRITNDLDSYSRISLTADGKSMAAVQTTAAADIWVAPAGDAGRAVRITSGSFPALDSIAWTPDGRIVFAATGSDFESIWITNADGSPPRQLTTGPGYGNELTVTSDGRYILYQYQRNIWRINIDGSNRMQLTHGDLDVHPSSSPSGPWVVYTSFQGWSPVIGGTPFLWKISVEGGDAVRLISSPASFPEISPDGRLLSCIYFLGDDPRFSASRIAILPAAGGLPIKTLERPADAHAEIHWAPTSRALDYVRNIGGVDSIWRQRLDGGKPVRITSFKADRLSNFAWSHDGARLAVVRGKTVSNIVLITGFQ